MKNTRSNLQRSIVLALVLTTVGGGVAFAESTIVPAAGDTISGAHTFDTGAVGVNGTVNFNVNNANLSASNNAVVINGYDKVVTSTGTTITTNGQSGSGRGFLILGGAVLNMAGTNNIDTSASTGATTGRAWEGICLGNAGTALSTDATNFNNRINTAAGSTTIITSGADAGIELWAGAVGEYNGTLTLNKNAYLDASNVPGQTDAYVNSVATSNFNDTSNTTINISTVAGLVGYSNTDNGNALETGSSITNVKDGAVFIVQGNSANATGIAVASNSGKVSQFNATGTGAKKVELSGTGVTGVRVSGAAASGDFNNLKVNLTGGGTGVNVQSGATLKLLESSVDVAAGTGAIVSGSTLNVDKTTVSNGNGVGINISNAATVNVTDSTITTANTAATTASGIRVDNGSKIIFKGENSVNTAAATNGTGTEALVLFDGSTLENQTGTLTITSGSECGMEIYSDSVVTNRNGATLIVEKAAGANRGQYGIFVSGATSAYTAESGSTTEVHLNDSAAVGEGITASSGTATLSGTTLVDSNAAGNTGIHGSNSGKIDATGAGATTTVNMNGTSGTGVKLDTNAEGKFDKLTVTGKGDVVGALVDAATLTATGSITTEKGNGLTVNNNGTANLTDMTIKVTETGTGALGTSGNGIAANGSTVNMSGTMEVGTAADYAPGINLDNKSKLNLITGTLNVTTSGGGGGVQNSATGINVLGASVATLAAGTTTTVVTAGASADGICLVGTSPNFSQLDSKGALNITTAGDTGEGIESHGGIVNLDGTTSVTTTAAHGLLIEDGSTLNLNGTTTVDAGKIGIAGMAIGTDTTKIVAGAGSVNTITAGTDGIYLNGNGGANPSAIFEDNASSKFDITLKGDANDSSGIHLTKGANATTAGEINIKDTTGASNSKGIYLDGTTGAATMTATGTTTIKLEHGGSGVVATGAKASGTFSNLGVTVTTTGVDSYGIKADAGAKINVDGTAAKPTAITLSGDNAWGAQVSGENSLVKFENVKITTATTNGVGKGIEVLDKGEVMVIGTNNVIDTTAGTGGDAMEGIAVGSNGTIGEAGFSTATGGDLVVKTNTDTAIAVAQNSHAKFDGTLTVDKQGNDNADGKYAIDVKDSQVAFNAKTDVNLGADGLYGLNVTDTAANTAASKTDITDEFNITSAAPVNNAYGIYVGGESAEGSQVDATTGKVNIALGGNNTGVQVSGTNNYGALGETTVVADTALKVGDGGILDVNTVGDEDVKLTGNLLGEGTTPNGVMTVFLNSATSFLTGEAHNANQKINLKLGKSAPWNVTGSSEVTGLENTSLIDMSYTGNDTYETITTDTYSGADGTINMDVDLGSEANGDKLMITTSGSDGGTLKFRDASLTTGVQVTGEKTLLVVGGAGAAGTAWTTPSLGSAIGNWDKEPTLEKANDGNWYLIKVIPMDGDNPGVQTILSGMDAAYGNWRAAITDDTLRKRLGDLRHTNEKEGIWARIKAGKLSADSYAGSYQMYQVGYDKKSGKDTYYGLAVDHVRNSNNMASGKSEGSLTGLSLYATNYHPSGAYSDLVLRAGKSRSSVDAVGLYPTTMDYDNWTYNASYELGKTYTKENGWFAEPEMQVVYGYMQGGDYSAGGSMAGLNVHKSSTHSLLGRVGAVVGRKLKNESDYYAKVNLWREFAGGGDTSMTYLSPKMQSMGLTHLTQTFGSDSNNKDTWLEVGLGGNVKLSKKTYMYGDVLKTFGADVQKTWQVNAGVRWDF